MLKKSILVLLSFNLLVSQPVIARDWGHLPWDELYWSEKAMALAACTVVGVTAGAVVVGTAVVTVAYAPIVIPIVTAKAAAAGAAIKTGIAVATPVVKTVGPIVFAADCAVKVANNAPEIQLYMDTTIESSERSRAKEDFEKCMNKHAGSNRSIVPEMCKKEKLLFALLEQVNANA